MTCPAVLKIKLAIAPTIPGKISTKFLPIAFNPLPNPLATEDKLFFKTILTPITEPIAVNIATVVKPYFFENYFSGNSQWHALFNSFIFMFKYFNFVLLFFNISNIFS